jgi:hypothetical protein
MTSLNADSLMLATKRPRDFFTFKLRLLMVLKLPVSIITITCDDEFQSGEASNWCTVIPCCDEQKLLLLIQRHTFNLQQLRNWSVQKLI